VITKVFHHPPFSLGNYTCGVGNNTNVRNNSQSLESGKRAATSYPVNYLTAFLWPVLCQL